jgi:hypothetical protein
MLYLNLSISYDERCHLFGLALIGIGGIKAGRTIQHLFKINNFMVNKFNLNKKRESVRLTILL